MEDVAVAAAAEAQQQHCAAAAEGKNCAARARNCKRHLRLAHRRQPNNINK